MTTTEIEVLYELEVISKGFQGHFPPTSAQGVKAYQNYYRQLGDPVRFKVYELRDGERALVREESFFGRDISA